MSGYRPEFIAALRLFARVSEAMAAAGFERPVLVGGAARDRLDQARTLFALNTHVDKAYLDQRISEESFGDHGIEDLKI